MLKFLICSYIVTLAVFGYVLFEINMMRYAETQLRVRGIDESHAMALRARKRGGIGTATLVVMVAVDLIASLVTIIWW